MSSYEDLTQPLYPKSQSGAEGDQGVVATAQKQTPKPDNTAVQAAAQKQKKESDEKKPWYKRHWWIFLVGALVIIAVIGVILYFFVFKKKEGFVAYNNSEIPAHKNINLIPETSYLESYIASSLGITNPEDSK